MTVLSDSMIVQSAHYGDLTIEPYSDENLQPASYDLTLGDEFVTYARRGREVQSIEDGPATARRETGVDSYIIAPGQFVLGHTVETIGLPDNVTAEVKGRSSLGRLGLIPHTAGWVDPGFEGQITLEFVNHSPHPVRLEPGMRCAQIVFSYTATPANSAYGDKSDTKYQNQSGVTESRIESEGGDGGD